MTRRIAIVGGGVGGTVLANRLADELAEEIDAGEVEVSLVTDSPEHVYKPVFLYVAFGMRDVADGVRPLDQLLDRRVRLRIAHVQQIDTDAKRIERDDGATLDYDYLVVTTGAELAPETVPGLVEGAHHYYSPDGATALRDALAEFTEGRIVLGVVGMPHMCPVAPLEFVFIADAWFGERGLGEDVSITYTYPADRAHSLDAIADWAEPRLADRGIETVTSFEVASVAPDERIVTATDGERLDYDLFVTIPPHRGDPLIARSGLGDEGWIDVDQHTLEAERADDVYAFGDNADLPTSKAGSAAHYEASVVAKRLASRVRGRTPTAVYSGKTLCFVEAGLDEATYVSLDYETQPDLPEPSRTIHWAKLAYNESYWLTARGLL
ncbi:NAD(P)/FAD-dependent oxidoreductase [Halorussus ruber]|uniref:NAD(P)/FAD-dependent oxidoreductase n=1 Tax=Halorussus ruber TaxID=1126238 RepID=UPI0010927FD3|nr:FAD/NAD(P)-binding oxidoreductase [Halorussus ruber]